MIRKDIFSSGGLHLLQQKITSIGRLIELGLKDGISFSLTPEFINGKQIHKWSEGHMCMDGLSGNESFRQEEKHAGVERRG